MQSHDIRAARAPQLPSEQLQLPGIEPAPQSTITLGRLFTSHRKPVIVITSVIVLITLFVTVPTLATGIVFGAGLFGVNSLIDSRMGEGDHE